MNKSDDDYHVSLFKPKTAHAKANRDMVILFFCIWAIAIFGFQVLLKVLEKPTPESSYVDFEKVWPAIKAGTAGETDVSVFARSVLSVLGKVAIKPEHKPALQNGLSWAIFQLADSAEKALFQKTVGEFEAKKSAISSIADPDYISLRDGISGKVAPVLGLSSDDVRSKILPLEVTVAGMSDLQEESKGKLPVIMSTYLIHNQSVLTDTKFLGFPFHYFYTAMFLLILFVGLCWLYCFRTDIINKKFNIAD
jgi:putative solute:sodium symporter small subunit